MNRLRVDHLNAFLGGGAAIAARRVHECLRAIGHDSKFWYVRGEEVDDPSYHRWRGDSRKSLSDWVHAAKRKIQHAFHRKRFKRALRGRPDGLELFSPAVLPHKSNWTARPFRSADVLHLHWLGAALDYAAFFRTVPVWQPVVWTLHDMNAFTGGCHYNNGCQQYQHGCGNCPQLGAPASDDLSAESFQAKLDSLPFDRIHVVAPSRWLLAAAQDSPILGRAASFHCIPYGIDLDQFSPRDRNDARRRLGLPLDRRVVAFGADDVSNRRKGVRELTAALNHLGADRRVLCAYFGRGELELNASTSPEAVSLGFVSDPDRLADIYSAADVFLMPSLEDNLPQTGIEAIACGTPVVAFDVGGVPDFVRPGASGALAPLGDTQAYANAVRQLFDRQYVGEHRAPAAEAMRHDARSLAESMFQPEVQADAYTSLYARILAPATQERSAA